MTSFLRHVPLALLLAACGGPPTTTDDATDTASADTGEAGADTGETSSDTGDTGTDTGSGNTATLTGTITRSAEPTAGGIGDLYVVVMDDNPMTGGGNALGAVIVEDADFTGASTSVTYTITDIPTSSAEAYVTAFLDDNGTAADAAEPGPDQGDLVAMEGVGFPTIVLDTAQTHSLDLDLSLAMPF